MSQGWHPNANLVAFSSLKNTDDMIQPQILGTVVGHLTFATFVNNHLQLINIHPLQIWQRTYIETVVFNYSNSKQNNTDRISKRKS